MRGFVCSPSVVFSKRLVSILTIRPSIPATEFDRRALDRCENVVILAASYLPHVSTEASNSVKRILVTGGAGFLGSHLCERLLARGHDVLCVDNFFTGSKDNIAHLLANPRFELMRHDVTFPLYVEVDEIYNLACPASPVHYQHDPVQTTKTSVHGAINMLGLAKRVRARHPAGLDQRGLRRPARCIRRPESYWGRRQSDRDPHVATTRASAAPRRCSSTTTASTSCGSRWRGSSTPTARACIRTTAAWCPTSSCRRCVAQDITIYGDGAQTRSFCYVDDLIEAMVRMMATADEVTGPVNIGNPANSRCSSSPSR